MGAKFVPRILKDKQDLAWEDGREVFQTSRKGWANTSQGKTRQQEVFPGHMTMGLAVISLYL